MFTRANHENALRMRFVWIGKISRQTFCRAVYVMAQYQTFPVTKHKSNISTIALYLTFDHKN